MCVDGSTNTKKSKWNFNFICIVFHSSCVLCHMSFCHLSLTPPKSHIHRPSPKKIENAKNHLKFQKSNRLLVCDMLFDQMSLVIQEAGFLGGDKQTDSAEWIGLGANSVREKNFELTWSVEPWFRLVPDISLPYLGLHSNSLHQSFIHSVDSCAVYSCSGRKHGSSGLAVLLNGSRLIDDSLVSLEADVSPSWTAVAWWMSL